MKSIPDSVHDKSETSAPSLNADDIKAIEAACSDEGPQLICAIQMDIIRGAVGKDLKAPQFYDYASLYTYVEIKKDNPTTRNPLETSNIAIVTIEYRYKVLKIAAQVISKRYPNLKPEQLFDCIQKYADSLWSRNDEQLDKNENKEFVTAWEGKTYLAYFLNICHPSITGDESLRIIVKQIESAINGEYTESLNIGDVITGYSQVMFDPMDDGKASFLGNRNQKQSAKSATKFAQELFYDTTMLLQQHKKTLTNIENFGKLKEDQKIEETTSQNFKTFKFDNDDILDFKSIIEKSIKPKSSSSEQDLKDNIISNALSYQNMAKNYSDTYGSQKIIQFVDNGMYRACATLVTFSIISFCMYRALFNMFSPVAGGIHVTMPRCTYARYKETHIRNFVEATSNQIEAPQPSPLIKFLTTPFRSSAPAAS